MGESATTQRVKVAVAQLTIGMYVAELDRPWIETPFLFQGLRIRNAREIQLFQEHSEYVWVDARQSIGVAEQIKDNLATPRPLTAAIAKVELTTEIENAEPIWHSARETSLRILKAARLGMELDVTAIEEVVKDCVESILRNQGAMLWLARIKNSDEYTAEHSLRVAIFAIALGRELGLAPYQLEQIGICGMLHDVGKIKIPDEILNKPGELTPEEFKVMQSHAAEGRKLLMGNQAITAATVDVAYAHHERLDGRGYPRGLDAARIPYFAKIVAVADSYDAINSDRVYRKGKPSLESLRILFDAINTHFDEDIVACFIRLIGIYPPGEIVELNSGEIGIIIGCQPDSKLKPRILRVLDNEQRPCTETIIDLANGAQQPNGVPYRIKEVHPTGAFGVNIEAYRRKGLIVPFNL